MFKGNSYQFHGQTCGLNKYLVIFEGFTYQTSWYINYAATLRALRKWWLGLGEASEFTTQHFREDVSEFGWFLRPPNSKSKNIDINNSQWTFPFDITKGSFLALLCHGRRSPPNNCCRRWLRNASKSFWERFCQSVVLTELNHHQ